MVDGDAADEVLTGFLCDDRFLEVPSECERRARLTPPYETHLQLTSKYNADAELVTMQGHY
jgi:hypothetical protein